MGVFMRIESSFQTRKPQDRSWLEAVSDVLLYAPSRMWKGRSVSVKIENKKVKETLEKTNSLVNYVDENNKKIHFPGLWLLGIVVGGIVTSPLLLLGWCCKKAAISQDLKAKQYYDLMDAVFKEDELIQLQKDVQTRLDKCTDTIKNNEKHKKEIEDDAFGVHEGHFEGVFLDESYEINWKTPIKREFYFCGLITYSQDYYNSQQKGLQTLSEILTNKMEQIKEELEKIKQTKQTDETSLFKQTDETSLSGGDIEMRSNVNHETK